MIDRIGEIFFAVKNFDQKNAPVFVQRLRDPNGQENAQNNICGVCPNNYVHKFLLPNFKIFDAVSKKHLLLHNSINVPNRKI